MKGKRFFSVAVVVASLLAVSSSGEAQSQTSEAPAGSKSRVIIRCGTLIDGKSEQPMKDVRIVVEGEKVVTLMQARGAAGEQGGSEQVIDLSQETCLPGLIDAHTHVLLQGDITAADYDEQLLKQSPEYRTILATVNAKRALD